MKLGTPSTPSVLILGCGYTGQRLARRLLGSNVVTVATSRDPARLAQLAAAGATVLGLDLAQRSTIERLAAQVQPGARVLYSIPPLPGNDRLAGMLGVLQALAGIVSRVVYLSTTGVYGPAQPVDADTPPHPSSARQHSRLEAEQAVLDGPWTTMVLRPAAIYGPWRGVHAAMRAGRYQLAAGEPQLISRIHVDDLSSHVLAALGSQAQGAYPVADELPAPAHEVATFCSRLLGLPMPPAVAATELHPTLQSGHRVDGSAVRRLLGVTLQYPTYREGIPAAVAAEHNVADV